MIRAQGKTRRAQTGLSPKHSAYAAQIPRKWESPPLRLNASLSQPLPTYGDFLEKNKVIDKAMDGTGTYGEFLLVLEQKKALDAQAQRALASSASAPTLGRTRPLTAGPVMQGKIQAAKITTAPKSRPSSGHVNKQPFVQKVRGHVSLGIIASNGTALKPCLSPSKKGREGSKKGSEGANGLGGSRKGREVHGGRPKSAVVIVPSSTTSNAAPPRQATSAAKNRMHADLPRVSVTLTDTDFAGPYSAATRMYY